MIDLDLHVAITCKKLFDIYLHTGVDIAQHYHCNSRYVYRERAISEQSKVNAALIKAYNKNEQH